MLRQIMINIICQNPISILLCSVGSPVKSKSLPYRARSGIQQQPGIGTFCEKGSVRTLQVPTGEEIDRNAQFSPERIPFLMPELKPSLDKSVGDGI